MCEKVSFPNDRFRGLLKYLKDEDKSQFGCGVDVTDVDKIDLVTQQGSAFLKYYLKEELTGDTLDKNRKRYQR